MSRAVITILDTADRERALRWIAHAPYGTRLEFKATKRTLDQNSRMWAMLTDVATQLAWYGRKMPTADWKLVFMDALKRELRIVPNIDGTGFVNLGQSSSDLSKGEMSDLIELIFKFGAEHGVVFHDPTDAPSLAPSHTRERERERA
jgi:hypothetical protein